MSRHASRRTRERRIRIQIALFQMVRVCSGLLAAAVCCELFCIGANMAFADFIILRDIIAKRISPEKAAPDIQKAVKKFSFFKKK